jgi:hypothetical protein
LAYLNSQIIGQQPQVTHAESLPHLLLELGDVIVQCPDDEEIVDVDSHHQRPACYTASVHNMLMVAAREDE